MSNVILLEMGTLETRVALLEDGVLSELYIEQVGKEREVGNIYNGKVVNILKGMDAAFIDIGLSKNAYLYLKESGLSPSDIKVGQKLLVQVVKEPIGDKGPKVSTEIALPGKYLVLMPFSNGVSISRRIESPEERERLKKIVEDIKSGDFGVIIRTACEGVEREEIEEDIKYLLELWDNIQKTSLHMSAPRLIYRDLDIIGRVVRDLFNSRIDRIIVNNGEAYESILRFLAREKNHDSFKDRIQIREEDFDEYGVEAKVNKLLQRKVWLKSGGYIIIDETEALTVIDVNTGKFTGKVNLMDTALITNMEAAREIARQIRLRDLGGIILVDFIDMNDENAKNKVMEELKDALKKDRTKTVVMGFTNLGLVEITRKRIGRRLSSFLERECPVCHGKGKIVSHEYMVSMLERRIERIAKHTEKNSIAVECSKYFYDYLIEENKGVIEKLKDKYKRDIKIIKNDSLKVSEIIVKPIF